MPSALSVVKEMNSVLLMLRHCLAVAALLTFVRSEAAPAGASKPNVVVILADAHWPAGISARGELRRGPGHVIDLMPTLVDVAGAKYPASRDNRSVLPAEGRSLVPALTGQQEAGARPLFWEHQGNKAVRLGEWKAVTRGRESWELYNLRNDRTETRNLAAQNPAKTRELASLWQAWATRCGVWEWDDLQNHRQSRTKAKKKQ